MNGGTIALCVVGAAVACCAFTHRRVISALIKHEPMPKAPHGTCGSSRRTAARARYALACELLREESLI